MSLKIALAGNPNSGKTTLFNALTGSKYKVANYPGVTVEKKEAKLNLPDGKSAVLIDLPGTYSLSGASPDEQIANKALRGEVAGETKPDVIIAVVDSTNMSRNLFLVTQLMELGVPVIVALNMIDLAKKDGLEVRYELLSRQLGLPVVPISARKKTGLQEIFSEILKASNERQKPSLHWVPALDGHQTEDADAYSRYSWIEKVIEKSVIYANAETRAFNRKVDAIITHRYWGALIFVLIMGFIFQSIFTWAEVPMELIDQAFGKLSALLNKTLPAGPVKSLLVDGVIAGVGSVVIFVPQIAILFFFLGILEDTGYLSRAAFLMDKIMRKFGLQGRSFIPLLSSFACAIPGVMATRTIPSFSDRLATIMVAPLMSCSARLPVYTLMIAAFVPEMHFWGFISLQGLVLLAMYLLGVIGAAIVAKLLKLTILRGHSAPFVMELPRFRRPAFRTIFRELSDRVMIFIKNAGSIILACSIVLWFLASYPSERVEDSFAGRIGHTMEPLIKPLGFNWEIGVGILASFAAREVFISSLSTVYNLQADDDDEAAQSLLEVLKEKRNSGTFSLATAISLMVFYVFACQCISTIAVCKRETGSWSWTAFMVIYMTVLAYLASFAAFNLTSSLI